MSLYRRQLNAANYLVKCGKARFKRIGNGELHLLMTTKFEYEGDVYRKKDTVMIEFNQVTETYINNYKWTHLV